MAYQAYTTYLDSMGPLKSGPHYHRDYSGRSNRNISPGRSSDGGYRSGSVESEEFGEYFDMDRYYENQASATNYSDSSSGSSPPPTPATPSSVDAQGSDPQTVEDWEFLQQQQDSYELLPGNGEYGDLEEATRGTKHPRSSDSSLLAAASAARRPRKVYNPEQTKKIRNAGACIPCRIKKTPCSESGICPKCQDNYGGYATVTCIRRKLKDILPSESSRGRWCEGFTVVPGKRRMPLGNDPYIYLEVPDSSSTLQLQDQPVRERDGWGHYQLEPNDRALGVCIDRWGMENLDQAEPQNFQMAIERTLVRLLQRLESKRDTAKINMVSPAFRLCCLARFWRTNNEPLYYHTSDGVVQQLPQQDDIRLRLFARQTTAHLESGVLCEVDKYLKNDAIKTESSAESWICLWASLWALILLYREALMVLDDVSRGQHNFVDVTEQLYNGLIVTYAAHFRTKKTLVRLTEIYDKGSGSKSLDSAFRKAVDLKSSFYEMVQELNLPTDELLLSHIIEHETQVNKRKARKKSSRH